MSDLPYAKREGEGHAGDRAYTYLGHEALTKMLRPLLLKWRLLVIPSTSRPVYEYRTAGNRTQIHTTLCIRIRVVNIDSPVDAFTFEASGNSLESGDKGLGISISTGIRQGLMKALVLPTGDRDIEQGDEVVAGGGKASPNGDTTQGTRPVADATPPSARGKLRDALEKWGVKPEDFRSVVAGCAERVAAQPTGDGSFTDGQMELIRTFVESQVTQKISPKDALNPDDSKTRA